MTKEEQEMKNMTSERSDLGRSMPTTDLVQMTEEKPKVPVNDE